MICLMRRRLSHEAEERTIRVVTHAKTIVSNRVSAKERDHPVTRESLSVNAVPRASCRDRVSEGENYARIAVGSWNAR